MDGRKIVETHFGVPSTSVPTPSQEMWSDRLMCLRKAIDDALAQARAEEREWAAIEGKLRAYAAVMAGEKASDVAEAVYLAIRARTS